MSTRWAAFDDRLDAADPGALRRYQGARAALAALTAWLTAHLVIVWFADRPMPAVGLFAVAICFINALVIVDARRTERQWTQALSTAMSVLALLVAGLLQGSARFYPAVLLVLIFASYVVRRRGLRPGELLLVLTMSLYFAEGSGVGWSNLAWYVFAVAIGVVSLWLWQFVFLPYDPQRSLRKGIRSLYHATAATVAAVAVALEKAPTPGEGARRLLKIEALAPRTHWPARYGVLGRARSAATSAPCVLVSRLPIAPWRRSVALQQPARVDKDLRRRLNRVRLSRRVIEGHFPGVLAPGGWTQAQIGQLQLALYNAEQGLARMVEGVGDWSSLSDIPTEIRAPLGHGLRSLQEALIAGSQESMQALAAESTALQTEVRAYASAALADRPGTTDVPPAPWVAAASRLVGGSVQVAQSVDQVRKIGMLQRGAGQPTEQPADVGTAVRDRPPLPPLMRLFGNVHVHPTTALGTQAVLATGLAMLVARLLNVDHSNWVFWTAFVVIAGSTGESLRRMMMRVAGTVAGVTVGVALALLTPDNTAFVVLFATICIFLTVYSGPLSYPRMVFWLNVGFVMVYTRLGVKAMDLLVARPATTLLGGLVAALVVVFAFPIHAGDRFKVAAARFLGAVDGYVSAFVDTVTNREGAQPLDAAQAKVAATYAQVEQTLPGVAFENNPLLQAQSPLTQQGTRIAALQAEVTRLGHAAFEDANLADDSAAAAADWMRTARALVHRDIEAIMPLLRGERSQTPTATPSDQEISVRSWMLAQERLAGLSQPGSELRAQVRTSGESALIRIHRIVSQLAAELGASVEETHHAGVAS